LRLRLRRTEGADLAVHAPERIRVLLLEKRDQFLPHLAPQVPGVPCAGQPTIAQPRAQVGSARIPAVIGSIIRLRTAVDVVVAGRRDQAGGGTSRTGNGSVRATAEATLPMSARPSVP
jgi:hypothetical protein